MRDVTTILWRISVNTSLLHNIYSCNKLAVLISINDEMRIDFPTSDKNLLRIAQSLPNLHEMVHLIAECVCREDPRVI